MAEQITHDVVKEALSMGGPAPVDDTATTTNNSAGAGEAPSGPTTTDLKSSNDLPSTTTNATSTDAVAVDGIHASETDSGDVAKVS